MEKRRKNRIILKHRYRDSRFRRKKTGSSQYIFQMFMVLLLPIVTGVFAISEDIITVVGGSSYVEASGSLRILSISLIFSILATFYTNAVLLPVKKEKTVMIATIISATVNVVLNLVILSAMKQNGAALTTLLAEFIMFAYQYYYSRDYLRIELSKNFYISIALGCIWIVASTSIIHVLISQFVLQLIMKICLAASGYLGILMLFKNDIAIYYFCLLKRRIKG